VLNKIFFLKKLSYHGIKFLQNPSPYKKRIEYNIGRFFDDRKAKRGYYKYPHNIIFLAGMGLSGSTWMKNLIARIPGYYTRYTPMPFEVSYHQDFSDSGFSRTPTYGYSLFKTHLNPTLENLACLNRNGVTKILITYRDYRDVALSLVHRLTKFPMDKMSHDYVDYKKMGFDQALEHAINWIANDRWLEGWFELAKLQPERYHFVKFEDLKEDTEKTYRNVLDFYEINIPDNLIKKNILESIGQGEVQQNMSISKALPWALSSNFRSGKVGGWKNEFKPHHIKLCKEKLGVALVNAGYEKDLEW
jgi:hypothetical protein